MFTVGRHDGRRKFREGGRGVAPIGSGAVGACPGYFCRGHVHVSTLTDATRITSPLTAVPKGRRAPPQVPGRRGARSRFYYTWLSVMVRASDVRDLEGCGPQVERLASGLAFLLPNHRYAERSVRGGSRGLRELRRECPEMRLPRRHAPDGPRRRRGALGGAIGLLRAGRGLCVSRFFRR